MNIGPRALWQVRRERLHGLLQTVSAYVLMNLADDVALLALMFC